MTARSQGHPVFQSQSSSTQHLRDRQRFFEDVLAHDVDMYYPQIHLLNDRWRPPLDSVSSMEVNIDSMELSEPLDISELESSDTFQQSEDPLSPLVSPVLASSTQHMTAVTLLKDKRKLQMSNPKNTSSVWIMNRATTRRHCLNHNNLLPLL
ncbi:dysbindin domain-containing protein 2-like isoform X2 [Hyla sarda]|uniref:dysbindin domain-containing protein 2-like isoform X2 n=1 Tax=Hyla sarda TaxID=327740 RepID=UPI0024C3FB82|nr:dysbindin domain-containing protein 2-like isoform X2 [Hyla sarda]XP_056420907.1 dysbindin domain-containing protein 2-like isoform X2 [Hyla sarda]